jgi:manganese/zinc/iron transport system ATP- binding protein
MKSSHEVALQVKNFSVGYSQKNYLLKDISFVIPQGVRCAIVGLNGSGKTTLLKGVLGLEGVCKGSVAFFTKKLSEINDQIAYVPQIKSIDWSFPITVFEVVGMGCYYMRSFFSISRSSNYKKIVSHALSQMNLLHKQDDQINSLSGGEKQRVFIARALAQNPSLYIFDEPLTGLDMRSEKIITEIFLELAEKQNKTVIAVHHDLQTLYDYFNWVIIVDRGVLYSGSLDKKVVDPLLCQAFASYQKEIA